MTPTHRKIYSGRLEAYIGPHDTADDFKRPLQALNGDKNFSLNLSALPTPKCSDAVTEADEAAIGLQYLQCAGAADALSVEIRTIVDGTPRLFILGRPGDYHGEPTVTIPFQRGNHELHVYPAEVFTADEAAQMFYSYYRTGALEGDYHLREIDLDAFIKSQAGN
ncbi:hypothetical protein [Nocardia seriolae]|uniref:Uncharacterized protein n=1 Tax=Nocardia seriolae TaxID=37332 RepID=A0A0B8NMB5_9NOCA|nr:hypothetical protein [Nocardia seriolae]APA98535.1 hypothetical protein NS506_04487 [Nocardia seriolae]MTJ63626.1 hypothetical protein [Nocardia seriolae]MTJ74311.1 hypothetical protein [Nocardia seriolae]MTJ88196.1 hypothetical protein [Nocardia seriolae]MTK41526.1 hypothetical protein [Nocardia seriolae]